MTEKGKVLINSQIKHYILMTNLNELEKKLDGKVDFCKGVAKIIDLAEEVRVITKVIDEAINEETDLDNKAKSQRLKLRCETAYEKERLLLTFDIKRLLYKPGKTKEEVELDMARINELIDYCIEHYPSYKESKFNDKYCVGTDLLDKTDLFSDKYAKDTQI